MQTELQNLSNEAMPLVPLSPADLATLVVRNFITLDTATEVAAKSGVAAQDFAQLCNLGGNSIAPEEAAEALRRGIIPADSGDPQTPGFAQAIAQGNLRDMWTPVIQALATTTPTPTDALDAYLKGQADHDTAMGLYQKFGGDPTYFDLMFDTQGGSPTPVQAAAMANRGIIPWDGTGPDATSYAQAFLEGSWKNKWADAFRQSAEYLPPPRTVTSMYKEGALTQDQAAQLLQQSGLTADLAQAYLHAGSAQKVAGSKELAEGTVTKLYTDKLVTKDQATQLLVALGYTADEAGYVLQVQDLAGWQKALTSAVSKVGSLYVSHRISQSGAQSVLAKLGVPSGQIGELIDTWAIEAAANVRQLTEAQVADAFKLQLLTQEEAQAELETLGYVAHDAWILLCEKTSERLPGEPAQ